MGTREHTILLISDDANLCERAREELKAREANVRVATASTVDAARRIVEQEAPSVILLEEASIAAENQLHREKPLRLEAVVSSLAGYAPVVVLGRQAQPVEMNALVAAGAADYVGLARPDLPRVAEAVERRLRQSLRLADSAQAAKGQCDASIDPYAAEDFGQILRHELNNPLTGILGNAELLLSEVRRKSDGPLPKGAQQRLETIAALAVRLRETVRRLSQEWQSQRDKASHL
jgi:signal transduction histidine kinase